MPHQNRVDPFGAIHADPARGLLTGNRGIIHDPRTQGLLRRRWSSRAWISCLCDFKGRKRTVMGANGPGGSAGWTNLFFLDEVTALTAGHRPCFHCRRAAATAFRQHCRAAWDSPSLTAGDIDMRLHGERLASGGTPRVLAPDELVALPDGAMVAMGTKALAVRGGALLPWSFSGYGPAEAPDVATASLLTPSGIVAVLARGYRPLWHASAP